ncbi:MAG: transposase, partial [Candidatus Rokuibacteriota bacterium]
VEALLKRADEVDQQEDERYGMGVDPWEIPEELKRRETRLARIQAAKAELEREAAEARAAVLRELAEGQREKAADPTVDDAERSRAATRAAKSEAQARKLDGRDDDDGDGGAGADLPQHRVPAKPDGTPKPDAQRNFTDADSRIMVKGGAFVQAYNAQVVVDGAAQVIVAQAVTNQPPDPEHLEPMLERVIENVGRAPERMSADTGYYAEANVAYCERTGIDAYIAVGRLAHGDAVEPPPPTESPAPTRKGRMRAKLQSFLGRAIYARRKVIVEPVFGQIQAARGFRRFSVRGLTKVRSEWSLVCLAHNLLKLFRALSAPARPLSIPT